MSTNLRLVENWAARIVKRDYDRTSSATSKIVSEYDQEIPQSQTAGKPVASRGKATQQSRDTRKTNKVKQPALSSLSR